MAVAPKEEILDQFLGNEDFPIEWQSDLEKQLFWVFDDLHGTLIRLPLSAFAS
jgi:hypothetical protein